MKKLRIGVIGAGRIGTLHAENVAFRLTEYAQLTAVSDVIDDKKAWAQSLGAKWYSSADEMISSDDIDIVLICSSTDTHADYIIKCARAKKHIFCEKPIDHDPERIKAALSEVEKANVKLQIGFNRRFDHNFAAARRAVLDGSIGDVHIVRITSRDPEPPNPAYISRSGGMFMDMTIHDFDMARYLSGSEVEEVYVAGAVLVDPEIGKQGDIDTAVITLKFASGAIGVIDNSRRAAYGYDQRAEVFGSKGSVQTSNDAPSTAIISTQTGVVAEKPKFFFLERYTDSFIEEMQQFFQAVLNDTPTPVDGQDGLLPIYIALAAQESVATGLPVSVAKFRNQ